MTTFSASLETYRVALVLNNIGVSALEHGLFDQGLKAFKKSLASFLSAFAGQPCNRLVTGFDYSRFPCRSEGVPSEFDIHPVEECDESGLFMASKYGPTSTTFFPIRLEECPSKEWDQKETNYIVARQLASILYNCGVGSHIVAIRNKESSATIKRRDGNSKTRHLLKSAQKSLKLSESAVAPMLSRDNISPCENVPIMMLQELVLNSLSPVCLEQELLVEVENAQRSASELRTKIEEEHVCISLFARPKSAAAA